MRTINQPGVPSPGADYVAALGMTPEQRADLSIDDAALERATALAAAQHEHVSSAKEIGAAIAASIADLIGATSGTRRQIPASVLKERREAWGDMEVLLAHYRDIGEMPLYELMAPLFCDDVLIPATRQEGRATIATRIHFIDIPNDQMVPRNEPAQKVMELYLRAIGGKTPDLGDTTYEAYLNRPRLAQVIGEAPGAPMLGSPGTLHQARATVLEDAPADERRYVGPKKQLGTLQPEVHGAI